MMNVEFRIYLSLVVYELFLNNISSSIKGDIELIVLNDKCYLNIL